MAEPLREIECYYTPRRVNDWLSRWNELLELATPTAGAIRYDVTTKGTPVWGSEHHIDPARFAEVKADLELAWIKLPRWSIHFQIVEWTFQGYDLASIAGGLRLPFGATYAAFKETCEYMARHLGWRE